MDMIMFLLIGVVVYVFVHIMARHVHGMAASEGKEEELFYSGETLRSRYGRKYDWDDANWDEDDDWDPLDDRGLEDSTMENALQSHYDEQFSTMIDFLTASETGGANTVVTVSRSSQNR